MFDTHPEFPPLFSLKEDSEMWTETATTPQIKAMIVACFDAMDWTDRAAFLVYASGVTDE